MQAYSRSLREAVLRGALADLLATGDRARTTAAVERHVALLARAEDRRIR